MRTATSLFIALVSGGASAQLFDFENLPGGFNPSNALSPLTITTGRIQNVISVGQVITWTQTRNDFRVFDIPVLAWSGRNTLYTENTDDTLIDTGQLMKGATVLTDPGAESGDVVRLIGLNRVSGNQFRVEAFAEGFDSATTLTGCTLSINFEPGFRFVLLQITTEGEAFDNLRLTPVPEPATLLTISAGLLALRRRKRS